MFGGEMLASFYTNVSWSATTTKVVLLENKLY